MVNALLLDGEVKRINPVRLKGGGVAVAFWLHCPGDLRVPCRAEGDTAANLLRLRWCGGYIKAFGALADSDKGLQFLIKKFDATPNAKPKKEKPRPDKGINDVDLDLAID